MNTGLIIRLGVLLPAILFAPAIHGQTADVPYPSTQTILASGIEPTQGEVVREIDDPHTGGRWLLTRDPVHPGGPGRLVLTERFRPEYRPSQPLVEPSRPVIHAGDRLVVEENTAVVEARLEAVALGPAVVGSPLNVRLKIGGKVMRAVALAPGRAAFLAEARP